MLLFYGASGTITFYDIILYTYEIKLRINLIKNCFSRNFEPLNVIDVVCTYAPQARQLGR